MSLKAADASSEDILRKAFDLGINYFDTADLYEKGENEKLIGRVFNANRKEIVLATKAGNQWRSDGSGWDWNPKKEYILQCAEESLRRLRTDYIDLFQLHGGTMEDPIEETIEAFELLVEQGKIRCYGISSIRPNVIREWANRSNIVSVMTQYSLLDRRPEEFTLPFLQENGIGVVTRGSVAQGLLVDKTPGPYLDYDTNAIAEMAEGVKHVSRKDRTAAQTAINYVLQNKVVVAAVVGIRTMKQLEDAVQTIEAKPLEFQEIEFLQNILPPNTYREHR